MNEEKENNQLLALVNQIAAQEHLAEQLGKAYALAQCTVYGDFLEQSKYIIYNYLWVLNDTLEQAKSLSEQILATLMKGRTSEPNFS